MTPEAAQMERTVATTSSDAGRSPWETREFRSSSPLPGGAASEIQRPSTRDTACAFACTRIAATVVSTGKTESKEEYAAPFAIPKQLSSYAATHARRKNHHARPIRPRSVT